MKKLILYTLLLFVGASSFAQVHGPTKITLKAKGAGIGSSSQDSTLMESKYAAYLDSIALASAIAAKQNLLNGTGFVKASGSTISYDNSTYLTTETDPLWTAWLLTSPNISLFTNNSNYLTSIDTINISNFHAKVRSLFSAGYGFNYNAGIFTLDTGNVNGALSKVRAAATFSLLSHNHTLDGLSNVTITSKATNDNIKWNGSAWVNFAPTWMDKTDTVNYVHKYFDIADSITGKKLFVGNGSGSSLEVKTRGAGNSSIQFSSDVNGSLINLVPGSTSGILSFDHAGASSDYRTFYYTSSGRNYIGFNNGAASLSSDFYAKNNNSGLYIPLKIDGSVIALNSGSSGSVGIGTNAPNASSVVDITSTTKGVLLPRGNTTQMNAIASPATGLLFWNTDSLSLLQYTGSVWQNVRGAAAGGSYFPLTGGSITGTSGAGFIGLIPQSSNPSTPAIGVSLFSRSTGGFSWVGSNGYSSTFTRVGQTANHVQNLMNRDYTVGDSTDIKRNADSITAIRTDLNTNSALIATNTAAVDLKADKLGTLDIEITDNTKGVIFKSSNGTRWRITIANDGSLITTSL